MSLLTLIACFLCLTQLSLANIDEAEVFTLPKEEKPVHQIIKDAQIAEPKILITGLLDSLIDQAANMTKDILRSNDYTKCDEEIDHDGKIHLFHWCYQNIAMNLGNKLKEESNLGQSGHFIVTAGTGNRAFTYVENPPMSTSSCMFELDQLVIQIMWFPNGDRLIKTNEKAVHQVLNDARYAVPKILENVSFNKSMIREIVNNTKNILRNNDYSKCDDDVKQKRSNLFNWCYQNIAMDLGNLLKANTELGKAGHFTVTAGTSNRAFTYMENPPSHTNDLIFSLDQLVIEIIWFK